MARKQQEKSQQTMEELLASAQELFGRKGYVATTIAEITRGAGYAKGSFYRHWDSKDGVFFQILERKFQQYRSERDRRIQDARDLREAMEIIWDFLEIIVRDRDWCKVILEFAVHAARDPELRQRLNESSNRLSNPIFAGLVRRHVKTDYPPEKIGALNTALFEGYLIHHALGTGDMDVSDVRGAAIRQALALGDPAALGE